MPPSYMLRSNSICRPGFPIVLDFALRRRFTHNDEDCAIAALEHSSRVSFIGLYVTGLRLEKMVQVMLGPFPLLTSLKIYSTDGSAPVLPDGFLGGSAPRLEEVYLDGIPFPTLPTLLLSTNNFVSLNLTTIPPTGYIPPEAMDACLVAFPRLKLFTVEFESDTPSPDRIRPRA
jgi:hypothetical protein